MGELHLFCLNPSLGKVRIGVGLLGPGAARARTWVRVPGGLPRTLTALCPLPAADTHTHTAVVTLKPFVSGC